MESGKEENVEQKKGKKLWLAPILAGWLDELVELNNSLKVK